MFNLKLLDIYAEKQKKNCFFHTNYPKLTKKMEPKKRNQIGSKILMDVIRFLTLLNELNQKRIFPPKPRKKHFPTKPQNHNFSSKQFFPSTAKNNIPPKSVKKFSQKTAKNIFLPETEKAIFRQNIFSTKTKKYISRQNRKTHFPAKTAKKNFHQNCEIFFSPQKRNMHFFVKTHFPPKPKKHISR